MGMMGASLAASLRKDPGLRIAGVVRSQKSKEFIESHELATEVYCASGLSDLPVALDEFDLMVLGMPVNANGVLLEELGARSAENLPLITDMSSTRTYLEKVAAQFPDLPFIGSHPMCGSEDTGPSAVKEELFRNRLVILIRSSIRSPEKQENFDNLSQFWKHLGSHVFELNERDHDLVLAYLSHAPHLLSSLLATVTARRPEVRNINRQSPIPITGGGLRDMLRIAGSNPEMWRDILQTNRNYIAESLRDLRQGLDELIQTVESDDLDWWAGWQNQSRKDRNEICGYNEDT